MADIENSNSNRHKSGSGKPFLERFSTLILATCLFLLPLIVYGAVRSLTGDFKNDINQWLPNGFEEAETYAWFGENFGVDEMVVASWPDCRLGNAQVNDFARALAEAEVDDVPVFERVVTGPQVLEQIKTDVGVHSNKAAMHRIRGLLIGPDQQTTCVLAFPKPEFKDQRFTVMETVYVSAEETIGVERSDLHLGGPTIDGATIDMESKRSLQQFMGFTVAVVFFLTWFRLRDLRLSLIVLTFSVVCAGVSLAVLFWTGGQMNLTMVMLPTLTFIMGVSASVHMVNYYRKSASTGNPADAATNALKDGGWPIALSSVTTAVGMASLAMSQVSPIRLFGLYSAIAILCSLPLILLVMPALLHMFKGRLSRRYSAPNMNKREIKSGVSRRTSWMMNRVCRNHWWLTLPAAIAMITLGMGVFKIKASVKIQNRFASSTKIIQDYEWLEKNLGPLVPMEVVLRFKNDPEIPEDQRLSLWEQLEVVTDIEDAITRTTAVNASYSAATFRPPIPSGRSANSLVKRRLTIKTWEQGVDSLESANLLRRSPQENLWRISLRVAALNDIDYGDFLNNVQTNVVNQIAHLDKPGISSELTGGIPLVYKAQHQILHDLARSFLTAFVFISLILIFILRNIRAGLVAMIPNIFPPLMVFGSMGWLGVPIEIGSVMTASVALGISVDDTIHFLTWYKRATLAGKSRYKAIQYAFDHCAKAMIDTTLICGLGVAPFMFSVFMPTVRFSRLLLILLMTALAGDLIVLPAILAGPAGLLFRTRFRPSSRKKKSRLVAGSSSSQSSGGATTGKPHASSHKTSGQKSTRS